MDDGQILQQFAESRPQGAFSPLVSRHVHTVYSACLRQLRDPVGADQATQAVFVLLARQAGRLKWETSLFPWLFGTAHGICRLISSPGLPATGGGGRPVLTASARGRP